MKYRKTNKVGKFEVKKVKNKGAVNKNVVRVAISPRSPLSLDIRPFRFFPRAQAYLFTRYDAPKTNRLLR